MISQSFIQELLDRVDIVDVIDRAHAAQESRSKLHGLLPLSQ